VKIGARAGGLAEVLEGLTPGDRIVVDGTGKLRAGSKIREVAAAPAAGKPRCSTDDPPADAGDAVPATEG
jgi:membrane fusion protein (multidrug efflux system)